MLSEIDASGWAIIVTAVFAGLTSLVLQVTQIVLSYLRDTRMQSKVAETQESLRVHNDNVEEGMADMKRENHKAATLAAKNAIIAAEKVAEKTVEQIAQVIHANSGVVKP